MDQRRLRCSKILRKRHVYSQSRKIERTCSSVKQDERRRNGEEQEEKDTKEKEIVRQRGK